MWKRIRSVGQQLEIQRRRWLYADGAPLYMKKAASFFFFTQKISTHLLHSLHIVSVYTGATSVTFESCLQTQQRSMISLTHLFLLYGPKTWLIGYMIHSGKMFLSCLEFLLECVNGIGDDYTGTKERTKTGKLCQRWDAKFPHRPKYLFTDRTSIAHTVFFHFRSFISNCSLSCLLKFLTSDPSPQRLGLKLLQKSWFGFPRTLVLHHWPRNPLGALQCAQL